MQLLTFGSQELEPNDQLHVNWKLASSTRCAARSLSFLSKKFNFKQQGGIFLWLTNIDLGHQSYFFFVYVATLLTTPAACVGLNKRWKSDFQVLLAWWTSVEIQSLHNAAHQKVSIDCLNTQESDILTKGQINETKG